MSFTRFDRARWRDPRDIAGLSFLLAGGLGNLLDRFHFGAVPDFLILSLGSAHTGIFNVADVAVCLGALLLFLPRQKRRLTARQTRR